MILWGWLAVSSIAWAQQYTKDGDLAFPKEYRQWVFLSSGLGMTYNQNSTPNGNPPFENVFVNQAAYQGFLKTGTWPDKTVMVLEIRASDSRVSINKDGRIQTNMVAMEVHVKDAAKGGWAFYGFANGAADTTFVQFYPTLIETAKQKGTYKETAH